MGRYQVRTERVSIWFTCAHCPISPHFLPSFSRSNLIAVPNPDLPFVQFVGDISGDEPGTVSEFYLLGNGNEKGFYLSALFTTLFVESY